MSSEERIVCRVIDEDELINEDDQIFIDISFAKQLDDFMNPELKDYIHIGDTRKLIFNKKDSLKKVRENIIKKYGLMFEENSKYEI